MADAVNLGKGDNKAHRKSTSGAKANKKKDKNGKVEKHNPHAFGVANIGRTKRSAQRNLDRAQRKEVVPQIDRAAESVAAPPVMVVVMGPSGCGKSTLIRSLVKYYSGRSLAEVTGPITVVTGKKRRLTFFECPSNDTCSMIDLAKVADLVLLMVDASFGFEMETFEFLNVLQVHGFPKVMGVLTHLDRFKSATTLRTTRKKLKQRFWTEIYQGAKMFYLSGLLGGGRYPKGEIRGITLQLSRIKFRPLVWRNTHPFVVVDRYEDMTPPGRVQDDAACSRDITVYGYVRGSHLRPGMPIHLIGAGDYSMAKVTALPDPCPLPEPSSAAVAAGAPGQDGRKAPKKRSSLNAKQTLLHAPMADVGGVRIDPDAVYIELGHNAMYTRADQLEGEGMEGAGQGGGEAAELLRSLQDVRRGVDEKMEQSELRLFKGGATMKAIDVPSDDEESDQEDSSKAETSNEGSSDSDGDQPEEYAQNGEEDELVGNNYDDSDSESDSSSIDNREGLEQDSGGGADRWKGDMAARAAARYLNRPRETLDLMSLVYGGGTHSDVEQESSDEEVGDLFRVKRTAGAGADAEKVQENAALESLADSARVRRRQLPTGAWDREKEDTKQLKNRFVTGDWGASNGTKSEIDGDPFNDDAVMGDFEDLVTGAKYGPKGEVLSSDEDGLSDGEENSTRAKIAKKKAAAMEGKRLKEEHDEEGGEGMDGEGEANKEGDGGDEDVNVFLEEAKKAQEAQATRNKSEFEGMGPAARAEMEGHRQGTYVRIELKGLPAEFVLNFDPRRPVVVGGLQAHEMSLGLVRCRVKRHRWHPRTLKSGDPLVFSLGWRRFQSVPIYAMEDEAVHRHRYLKYSPEHMHCTCVFYGPICPQGTGLMAFQTLSGNDSGFRVSLTGSILELDANFVVSKKLKLIGHPEKIHKKTAFIKGMFSSDLEVARFEGASLKTVSGVRGQIKKAAGTGSKSSGGNSEGGRGKFRATFEDKILMSDTIICRLWAPVEVKHYYNPVTSLLDGDKWVGARNTAAMRRAQNIPIPLTKDSLYKPIERVPRHFNPLPTPKSLQAALPYASKPKQAIKRVNKSGYIKSRAVVMEPAERKRMALLNALGAIRREKEAIRAVAGAKRRAEFKKKLEKVTQAFAGVKKDERKRKFRDEGQAAAKAKIKAARVG